MEKQGLILLCGNPPTKWALFGEIPIFHPNPHADEKWDLQRKEKTQQFRAYEPITARKCLCYGENAIIFIVK